MLKVSKAKVSYEKAIDTTGAYRLHPNVLSVDLAASLICYCMIINSQLDVKMHR